MNRLDNADALDTAPDISDDDIKLITSTWNKNEFCNKIAFTITPMSFWYDKIRLIVQEFGMDHLIQTIKDLPNQEWLVDRWKKRKIFVDFIWFIEPDNYRNVIAGKYKVVFEKTDKPEKPKNRFNDFEQRRYTDLDAIEQAMIGG